MSRGSQLLGPVPLFWKSGRPLIRGSLSPPLAHLPFHFLLFHLFFFLPISFFLLCLRPWPEHPRSSLSSLWLSG